jgi:thiol:disulfide interchange protein
MIHDGFYLGMNRKITFFSWFFTLVLVGVMTLLLAGCEFQNPINTAKNTVAWVVKTTTTDNLKALPFLSKHPAVLYLKADLCAECQKLQPVLDAVQKKHPHLPVLTLNISKTPPCSDAKRRHQAVLTAFQPMVTPTLMFFKQGGETVEVIVGATGKNALERTFQTFEDKAIPVETSQQASKYLSCSNL